MRGTFRSGGQAWEDFVLTEDVTRTIVLTQDRTVSGRIVDAGGHPVPEARIGVWYGGVGGQGNLRIAHQPDADGRFAVLMGRGGEEAETLAVLYPRGARFPCLLTMQEPGASGVELVLGDKHLRSGTITARTRHFLKVQQMDGVQASILVASQGGVVEVGSVPAGNYEINLCRTPSDLEFLRRVTLKPGERLDLGALD